MLDDVRHVREPPVDSDLLQRLVEQPLAAFREFAFVMAVGILIDTFLVRTFLVSGLISLVGRASWWPGVPREAPSDAEY